MKNIRATRGKVIVTPRPLPSVSTFLYLAEDKSQPMAGIVLSVGETNCDSVQVGDHVVFSKMNATGIRARDLGTEDDHIVVSIRNILGVYEP